MRSDPGRPARVLMAVEAWPDDRSPSDGVFLRDQARALAPHLVLGVAIGRTCSPRQWLRRGPTPTRNAVIREEGFCVFRAECFVATTRSRRLLSSGRVRALARAAEGFERLFGPPELIHAHGAAFAGEAALEVARRRGIPVVITEHYSFVDELLRTYGPRLLDVYEAADVLLVPSAEQSRRLRELGVCRAIRVRHNAVDAGLFAFEPIAPPAPGESWRILTVTRDHEVKDVPLLMDALGRLAPGACRWMCGSSDPENSTGPGPCPGGSGSVTGSALSARCPARKWRDRWAAATSRSVPAGSRRSG